MKPQAIEEMLDMPDVLRILRISRPTLEKIIREKKLPAIKVGRHWKFQPRHVREFVETGEVK